MARGPVGSTTLPGRRGRLVLVFHAHLPYVHHPERERFLEEDWLFEAITETYVPLADTLLRLSNEGRPVRAAVSVSPTLSEMLASPLLQDRYEAHTGRLIECADDELERRRGTDFQPAAEMYCERLRWVRDVYRLWGRDPLNAFRQLASRGVVELLGCAATHALLPLVKRPESVRAQIELGCRSHERRFGKRPRGFWLPECAYVPSLEGPLRECGVEYIFLDSHGVLSGEPAPKHLTYRPVRTPAGLVAFARDPDTGRRVWSADHGYPGDPVYREFYRDVGFDGDSDALRRCLHPDGVRRQIGLKYHRVTGRVPLDEKAPYDPAAASERAREHAEDFVAGCEERCERVFRTTGLRPVICAMYDAELFGHWWFEGVEFIGRVFRRLEAGGLKVEPALPGDVLASCGDLEVVSPAASSWGDKGYFEQWLNEENDWVYPLLHRCEDQMAELAGQLASGSAGARLRAGRFAKAPADALTRRALNQAARELMLAQSSDWAFQMSVGSAREYAVKRTRGHVEAFQRLYGEITAGALDEAWLAGVERRDAIFQEMDYTVFA